MKGSHPSKSSADIEAAKGETREIVEHYSTAYSRISVKFDATSALF